MAEIKTKKFIEDDSRDLYAVVNEYHDWYMENKGSIKVQSTVYGVTHMSEIDPERGTNEYRRHLLVRYTEGEESASNINTENKQVSDPTPVAEVPHDHEDDEKDCDIDHQYNYDFDVKWDTETINEFMKMYDEKGVEQAAEHFKIKVETAESYYKKWKSE